jgi:hypothetical protein
MSFYTKNRKKGNNAIPSAGTALDALSQRIQGEGRVNAPRRDSFADFLLNDAQVPIGGGRYGNYTFEGREALVEIVQLVDKIIGEGLADSMIALAGGAQFGKSILELNLAAYVTGQRFQNCGLYLPDDDLVEGIVDSKFRPDVVDQIEWFAAMTQVGKALNKSGKAVNRKGAFLVTDGERKSVGMIRGLGKVPTTFSMDVAAMDEVDDIQPKMAKYVKGRLTASKLRFILKIGTQRVNGRGMQKAWKDGSQGVMMFTCPKSCSHCEWNLEENFPQIIRCAINGIPQRDDPKLTFTADFRRDGSDEVVCTHDPLNLYYIACPECGAPLNRRAPVWKHLVPERIKQRNWSFRISQLGIDAIDLSQVVAHWLLAVEDAEEMVVFRCDRLGLPQSTSQALAPDILDRARRVEVFDMPPTAHENCVAFGGLDMGDACWLLAREVEKPDVKRVLAVEKIAAANVVARTVTLFQRLKLAALFVDQRPLVTESRTLALILNGLQGLTSWPRVPDSKDAHLTLPGGLEWDGPNGVWKNLRCAVVRFDKKKVGAGIEQGFDIFEEGGQTKFVPLINCNRYETIERPIREFLTPHENIVEVVNGKVREDPTMRLPRRVPGSPVILETLDAHLIAGSEREKLDDGTTGDFVDQVANHLLLSDAYSALAELIVVKGNNQPKAGQFHVFTEGRIASALASRHERSLS